MWTFRVETLYSSSSANNLSGIQFLLEKTAEKVTINYQKTKHGNHSFDILQNYEQFLEFWKIVCNLYFKTCQVDSAIKYFKLMP